MNKIRIMLNNFMRGRNGNDDLNRVLLIAALVLELTGALTRILPLEGIGYVVFLLYVFRAFSRNLYRRQAENRKFVGVISFQKKRFTQRKEYKYMTCGKCRQHIRVPRGKGKIEVTCPKCGNKKIVRS